jgi:serine/threonine protein kinase
MVESAKSYDSQYMEDKWLRRGAFGAVYLATHRQENKQYVANKMEFEPTPDGLSKCLNEVKLLASMQHPNIVLFKEYFV